MTERLSLLPDSVSWSTQGSVEMESYNTRHQPLLEDEGMAPPSQVKKPFRFGVASTHTPPTHWLWKVAIGTLFVCLIGMSIAMVVTLANLTNRQVALEMEAATKERVALVAKNVRLVDTKLESHLDTLPENLTRVDENLQLQLERLNTNLTNQINLLNQRLDSALVNMTNRVATLGGATTKQANLTSQINLLTERLDNALVNLTSQAATQVDVTTKQANLTSQMKLLNQRLDTAVAKITGKISSLGQRLDIALVNLTNGVPPQGEAATNMTNEENLRPTDNLQMELERLSANLTGQISSLDNALGTLTEELQRMASTDPCPFSYVISRNMGSCYLLKQVDKTWAEAKQFCNGQGAYLVEVDSQNEIDLLEKLHDSQSGSVNGIYWTSGRRQAGNSFIWDHSTRLLPINSSLWDPGEPNNWNNLGEDRVNVNIRKHGLNDNVGDGNFHFVCEKAIA